MCLLRTLSVAAVDVAVVACDVLLDGAAVVVAAVGIDAGAEAVVVVEETDVSGRPLALFVSPVTTTSSSLSSVVLHSPLSFVTAFCFPRSVLKAEFIFAFKTVV